MILRSLDLENIRSYKTGHVDFELGITLFAGEVGSGKSTLLDAVEFALFGLEGKNEGNRFLRLSENKGKVKLEFSKNESTYTITRFLERKNNGHVESGKRCMFTDSKGTHQYTSTELKPKVLKILELNEPEKPGSENKIWRYAVFSPQESMKQILQHKENDRLTTIRKVLRLEEYQIAKENAKELSSIVRNKLSPLSNAESDLTSHESELVLLMKELDNNNQDFSQYSEYVQNYEKELERINTKIDKHNDAKQQIDDLSHLHKTLSDLRSSIESERTEIKQLNELTNPSEDTVEIISKKIDDLENNINKQSQELGGIYSQIRKYEEAMNENICPTCNQEVTPSHFKNKLELENSKKDHIESSKSNNLKLKKELQNSQSEIQIYDKNQVKINERSRNIDLHEKNYEHISTQVESIKESLKEIGINDHNKILDSIKTLQSEHNATSKNYSSFRDKKVIAETNIKNLKDKIKTLNTEIEKDKINYNNYRKFFIIREWINDYFIPTIGVIEQNMLSSFIEEFNEDFKKWFSILIDDPSKDTQIDSTFTPMIEQQGGTLLFSHLSGGEKTSIALAYRLALNKLVSFVANWDNSNLLILDEPTDGFSTTQLSKIRDIFNELTHTQIIVVSHEKELASYVDQTFYVKKIDDKSSITRQ